MPNIIIETHFCFHINQVEYFCILFVFNTSYICNILHPLKLFKTHYLYIRTNDKSEDFHLVISKPKPTNINLYLVEWLVTLLIILFLRTIQKPTQDKKLMWVIILVSTRVAVAQKHWDQSFTKELNQNFDNRFSLKLYAFFNTVYPSNLKVYKLLIRIIYYSVVFKTKHPAQTLGLVDLFPLIFSHILLYIIVCIIIVYA